MHATFGNPESFEFSHCPSCVEVLEDTLCFCWQVSYLPSWVIIPGAKNSSTDRCTKRDNNHVLGAGDVHFQFDLTITPLRGSGQMLCAGMVCWHMLCSLLCYSNGGVCSTDQEAERESTSMQITPHYEDVKWKLKKYKLEKGGVGPWANVGIHIACIRSSKNDCLCKLAWCKGSQ